MDPAIISLCITAIEKGIPVAIDTVQKINTAIAESKTVSAEDKVNLLVRLNNAYLPVRDFKPMAQ